MDHARIDRTHWLTADMPRKPRPRKKASPPRRSPPVGLRIVGGTFRGRKLKYSGAESVRPMKDRLRENVFNLIGPQVAGSHAVDLFAGTGALALEALSRGAVSATLIEQHHGTAEVIRQNITTLGVELEAELIVADVFRWWPEQALPTDRHWTVFCSPPYEFFIQREGELLQLVASAVAAAPAGSLVVVESDLRFDAAQLPGGPWDVRDYPPARVALLRV